MKDDTEMTEDVVKAPTKTAPRTEEGDDIIEVAKAMALAALLAVCIRTFLFEPFNIPSGSMLPSLLVGDYLFVEKYAYGYSKYSFPLDIVSFEGRVFGKDPKRGDVAVFRQPKRPDIDYIKRIVGLPGDVVQVKKGILYINGNAVVRDFRGIENVRDEEGNYIIYNRYVETLPGGVEHYIYEMNDEEPYDDTQTYVVPEGYYFAMGDNRDRSQDSRVTHAVGPVPAENLVGRAWFLFFSTNGVGDACDRDGFLAPVRSIGCKLVTWPRVIRYKRIFKRVQKL
ncbi:MAG: signal peptidase I [Alphaproteobacteria bacterium]|nr:signal peptidase I [Alphaproteobacteria bacterium]